MDFEDDIHMNINISDIEEVDYIADNRVVRRYIRDVQNPFEYYDEDEFKRRFRFNKDLVLYRILPKIIGELAKINKRGLPIPPGLQLLVFVRYYATASFQVI